LIAVTDGTQCVLVEGRNRVTTLAMFPTRPGDARDHLGWSYGRRIDVQGGADTPAPPCAPKGYGRVVT
jgi:hypothetical protein